MKKYEYVQHTILKMIKNGELTNNSLLPSEKALMDLCNVSRNVVRQALKNLTDQGITRSIKGVGTFVKEIPTDSSSATIIGLITFFPNSYIFPTIIEGIDTILHPKGFHLLIGYSHHTKSREKALLHQFIQKGVAGIILEAVGDGSPSSSNYRTVGQIVERKIPIILIDNPMGTLKATSIILNDRECGVQSAIYFLMKGHKDFAIFYQSDYFPKVQRMMGMKEYLEKEEHKVNITLFPFTGQGTHSNASEIAKSLIESYDGTHLAIFSSSDEDAHMIIQIAHKANLRIGEDISIIGFDNFESLGITTFTHPSIHMGKIAAREMLDLIDNSDDIDTITITLQANFVERHSVKDMK